jgi:hypothetical protein
LGLEGSLAFSVSNNVTKITDVTNRVLGSTVCLTEGVEVSTSRSASYEGIGFYESV